MDNDILEMENIFENNSNENGFIFWYAYDLMAFFDYKNFSSFKKCINKAISICAKLDIKYEDNFVAIERDVNGKQVDDYKLSRFACFLIVMNSDPKKSNVALTQAYLAKYADMMVTLNTTENFERIDLRDELSREEKLLSGVAKTHKVDNYAFFQDAGYRGLYNMSLKELKILKNIPHKKTLLDFMGSTELGANIFRMTQTKEKIQRENIQGQHSLEQAHKEVGKEVRKSMQRMGSTLPEDLAIKEDIKKVKSNLKQTHKKMKNIPKK